MRLTPDLPLHRLTVPTPFPVGPVNLYLLAEPEPVLVDAGPAMPGSLALVEKLLAEAGTGMARLRKILLTHFHQDHVGLAAELAERSGATIFASPCERSHLGGDARSTDFYRRMLEEAGTPAETLRLMTDQFRTIRSVGRPVVQFQSLEGLEEVRCGPATFRTLRTPGHTPGSTSLWEPERRILLAADTVIKHITPNPFLSLDEDDARDHDRQECLSYRRFPSLRAYFESLDRIRALNPAIIHCGHGEPVENFPEHHQGLLAFHRKRLEAIRGCLRRGVQTVYEVAVCLFPEVAGRNNPFLAISEVYAHLDLMEEKGEVSREMRHGVAVYNLKD